MPLSSITDQKALITGPDDDCDQSFGIGGRHLHDWLGKGGDGIATILHWSEQ